jgi:hypothetical protein
MFASTMAEMQQIIKGNPGCPYNKNILGGKNTLKNPASRKIMLHVLPKLVQFCRYGKKKWDSFLLTFPEITSSSS